MQDDPISSFFRGDYMPHGHCYLWQEHILWTNVLSDLVIAASYFSIPIAISLFAMKRKDIGNQRVLYLFSAFILLCGITHLFGIYTIWHGVYGAHGLAKLVTAIVSLTTAVYVYKLLPNAITLPTPAQYEGVKRQLAATSDVKVKLEKMLEEQDLVGFMLDSMPVSAAIVDADSRFLLTNQYFREELGYTEAQLKDMSVMDIMLAESGTSPSIAKHSSGTQSQQSTTKQFLVQIKTAKQDLIPVEVTLKSENYKGMPTTLVTIKNLTEYRQIKRQLLQSHQQLERAINASEDGIWEWELNSQSMFWSTVFSQLIGFSADEPGSVNKWKSHIHADFLDVVEDAIANHIETGKKLSVEYLGKNKKGEFGWFNLTGNSVMDDDGKPALLSGSLRYIQDSKLLEQKVAEKTEFLNTIYDGSDHAIWMTSCEPNNEFRFLAFNRTAGERINRDPDEIISKTLSELTDSVFPPQVIEELRNNYAACATEKTATSYTEQLPVGDRTAWFQTTLYPIFDKQGEVKRIVGTAIEVTEQKRVEQALAENQQFLEKVINSAVCGIYLYDFKLHKNTQVNKRYTDILGYSLDELNKQADLFSLFHPDDIPAVKAHIEQVYAAKEGELVSLDYRFKHKNGNWVWCTSSDCIISYSPSGEPLIMLGTFVDITENVTLLAQLRQSNEYLERFAFVASHDLQEPLRKITAFSDALAPRIAQVLETDEDAKFEFSRLQDAAQRMRTMIKDILRLSRVYTASIEMVSVTLNQLVNKVTDQLEYLIEESGCTIELENADGTMRVDESLMIQLLQNLISNSIKFCRTDNKPHIRIALHKRNARVDLIVEDNGIGIDSRFAEQIFDPFYRLHAKNEYKGTGIGLTICKQIAKVHDGTITCQPADEVGTRFIVTIPQPGLRHD